MNFKEKWSKQNNSVKLLLKKLKRHDTLVVGISVVIATALCGGLIYLSTPVVTATAKEELMQDEMVNSEKTAQKLDELREYLDGIDKTVAENQKSLSTYSEKSRENNRETNELTEKMTNNVTEKVVGLDKDMKELRELIKNTEASIENLRQAMEKGDNDNRSQLESEVKNLYVELEKIENKYDQTYESNQALMNEVKNVVKTGNKDLSKEMLNQYNELLGKLTETDVNLSLQNKSALAEFKSDLDSLSLALSSKFNELDSTISNGVNNLNNGINGVNDNISGVNDSISGVNDSINGVNSSISGVNDSINGVNNNITDVNGRISGVNESINGVNSSITNVNDSINGVNNNITNVHSSISGVNDNITGVNNNITNVNNSIGGVKTDISGKIDTSTEELNQNIDEKLGNLSGTVQVDLADLKTYISSEVSVVNEKLGQVFQSVSNGKKLLASALLTKGVQIREDATFAEIANAIINIDTKYVLPEDEIPGTIEYTYHYHSDGSGNECSDSLVDRDRQGGCYTTPVYHVHTDSCYEKKTVYTYRTHKSVTMLSYEGDYYTGEAFYKYHCSYCGKTYVSTGSDHYETTTSTGVIKNREGIITKTKEQKTKICSYEDDQLEGYAAGCGYVHGQVIGAKVTFTGAAKYDTTTGNGTGSGASNTANEAVSGTDSEEDEIESGDDTYYELSGDASYIEEGDSITPPSDKDDNKDSSSKEQSESDHEENKDNEAGSGNEEPEDGENGDPAEDEG